MAVFLRPGHTHELQATSTVSRDHTHRIAAISSRPFVRTNGNHFHRVRTLTTFDRAHAHFVWTKSGDQIHLGHGKHVHRVRTLTSADLGHRHLVKAFSLAAPNIPPLIVRRALNGR